MIDIVVCDDHPLLKEGVKKVVNKTIDMRVTGEASNWKELSALLDKNLPDIVILDINLSGKSGVDILKDLTEMHPHLPVLILSIHSEERFAIRTLKAGAMGYVNKSSITGELVKAVRKILTEKRKYISPQVAELLSEQVGQNSGEKLHEALSDREFQVLCEIASGKNVNEIAEELSLSVQTVYTYRANIKEKMNFKSNVEMARYAIDNNLIE